jgi:predicted PurR-regulated permease PerM
MLLRTGLWVVILAATIWLLVVGRGLLLPLVLGLVVWYMVDAAADSFEKLHFGRHRLPRWTAVVAAIACIAVFFWFLGTVIGRNIKAVLAAAPDYETRLETMLHRGAQLLGFEQMPTLPEMFARINLVDLIGDVAGALANVVGMIGVVLVYAAFFLVEQIYFGRKLQALFPDPARLARVRDVLDRISADIHRYIQIKSALAAMTCAVGYAVMTLVGVDFAGFWAVLIFFLYFIPTLGSIVAIAAPALLTLVQFATLTPFLIVLLVFGPVQILMANAVEPAIMGRSLNLSPLVIIGSLMLWGTIWGVIGMFLCVPIMVVLMIVLANFEQTRPIAILLSANGEVPRPAVD